MSSLTMSEEHQIIERTIAKERGKLFNFIRKRVNFREDAEDILQDVLLQLVNAYDSVGAIDKIASWMYRVANNKIIDARRKKKAELFSSQGFTNSDDETLYLQDILPDLSNTPEDLMLRDLIWEGIQNALEELPQEQQDVFRWHELDDMSFKEIAAKTGVSENTLFSRKRYALLHLRERMKEIYKELYEIRQ